MTVSACVLMGLPSESGTLKRLTSLLNTAVLVVNIGKHPHKTRLKLLSVVSRLARFLMKRLSDPPSHPTRHRRTAADDTLILKTVPQRVIVLFHLHLLLVLRTRRRVNHMRRGGEVDFRKCRVASHPQSNGGERNAAPIAGDVRGRRRS